MHGHDGKQNWRGEQMWLTRIPDYGQSHPAHRHTPHHGNRSDETHSPAISHVTAGMQPHQAHRDRSGPYYLYHVFLTAPCPIAHIDFSFSLVPIHAGHLSALSPQLQIRNKNKQKNVCMWTCVWYMHTRMHDIIL